jgi:PilZ domain
MSQRRETRVPIDRPVQLTVYGQPDRHYSAKVKNVSGRGLGIELESPVSIGSALKIVLEDAILLGEVIYCRNQGDVWYAGVELEQALCGLAELASALGAFNEPYSGPEQQNTVNHAGKQHQ